MKIQLQLKARKCMSAQESIEWLGYKFPRTVISLINAKAQGLGNRLRPTILRLYGHSLERSINSTNYYRT